MTKKVALINVEIEDTIKDYFKNTDIEFVQNTDCDLVVYDDYNEELPPNAINIHPSLLPAFDGKDAIKKAFLAGVKVSGITIHSANKIIAQYPVLIGIDAHIDDFIKEIKKLKEILVPRIIEALLEDKVFDFQDSFHSKCSHNCSKCKNYK